MNDLELYYTEPSQECFDDMKINYQKLRIEIDPNFGYIKVEEVENIQNYRDNFMFLFAKLDIYNQITIYTRLKKETQREVSKRLPDGYFQEALTLWNTIWKK